MVCYGVMTLIGSFGNIVSILCLRKKNQVRKKKLDPILLSLSICDVLMSAVVFPLTVLNFYCPSSEDYPHDHSLTKVRGFLTVALTSISSLTIIQLAVVKYIKISQIANFHRIVTHRRLRIMIIFTWLFCFGSSSPRLLTNKRIRFFTQIVTITTLAALPLFYYLIYRVYKQSRSRISTGTDRIVVTTDPSIVEGP